MALEHELTLGERRVRVNFNPGANQDVETLKRLAAAFIDTCEQMKHARLKHDEHSEEFRLWALAMTNAEDAAMWAVKAATS